MTYVPWVGPILGTLGSLGNLLHGAVGYICLVGCNVIHLHTVVSPWDFFLINLVDGIIFGYIYGVMGYAVDTKIHKEVLNVHR